RAGRRPLARHRRVRAGSVVALRLARRGRDDHRPGLTDPPLTATAEPPTCWEHRAGAFSRAGAGRLTPDPASATTPGWQRGKHITAHKLPYARLCFARFGPTAAPGSPPHARGARVDHSRPRLALGIIPAYAGSTNPSLSVNIGSPDHPRVRGEHGLAFALMSAGGGSSPRARGALPRTRPR